MRRILLAAVLCGLCLLALDSTPAQQGGGSNSWSNEDYDFYAGDFNGDGYTDILFIARTPGFPSGILLSDGTAPTILSQTWASNYLGIPWSPDAYTVVLGDFNGDGKTDIFLQSTGPGDSYLLLTDSTGKVSAISQTMPAEAMGLAWTADQHHLVAGDFGGTGRAGLFFQPTVPGGMSAVVYTDANGQFTSGAPTQTWSDGYLGFNWSLQDANVYAGDFNGDGHADLLIQAQPVGGAGSDPTAMYYPPNMNGVVLSAGGSQPFTLNGVQSWSRNAFGVDWSPFMNNLIIGDFDGDGRADVLLQPLEAGRAAYLLFGQASGPIFSTASGSLPSDSPISGDVVVLVPGRFSGGSAASLLVQSTSRDGSNAIAKNIGNGIHPATLTLPTLSPSTVSTSGIQYPSSPNSSSAPTTPQAAQPLAGTVAPTSAGRTAAQFSVSPTGAATYNIPLWTPPGARGIEPHLALHYTSGGPDGPMGPGWSLTGLSAIVRCGKTYASNGGVPAGVTLAPTDDMCLDGNRLRVTSGTATQGYTGSTYQTEIADFSNVTANGASGQPLQYFTVQGKDGRSYEYGNTTDSRILGSGASVPYAWALDKVSDRQGNNMVFTYSGGSMVVLAKIQYTATPKTGNAAPYEVDFTYVPRAGGTTITKYVAGYPVSLSNQLDHVTVLSLQPSSTTVRKYQLGYAASSTTNRPLLQTLQECGGSSGTDCIRPTTIGYQSGGAGWITTASSTGQTLPSNAPVFPIDLNGDGITDLVYPQTSGSNYAWYVRYGSANGTFGSPVSTGVTTLTTDILFPGDFAGRGHPDLLYPSGGVWWRLYWNGTALATASTGAPVNSGYNSTPATIADVNGDGLPDLVWAEDGDLLSTISVQLNTTTPGGAVSFAASQVWYSFPRNVSCESHNPCNEFHVAEVPYWLRSVMQVADFNGDGLADLFVKVRQHTQNGDTYWWYQLLSTRAAFSASTWWTVPAGTPDPQLTDWNGDGCTDIVSPWTGGSHWTVNLSSCSNAGVGTGGLDTGIPNTQGIMIADWDGDGQLDLLTAVPGGNWKVARSTGSGIAALVDTGIAAGSNAFFVGDFNGDGLTDLAWIDSSSGNTIKINYHNYNATPPDLGTSFVDGFGITFSPSYVPISQYNYTEDFGDQFPYADFKGPMYVVSQFSASDGLGGTYTNDFYYWGALLHLQGRGFEGFYKVQRHDSRNGVYQYFYYAQAFPYTGMLLEQDTIASNGTTYIGRTVNTPANLTPGGLVGAAACTSCYFPYAGTSTVYNYEPTGSKQGGSGSYTSYTVTNYTYDTDSNNHTFGSLVDTKATTTDTDSAAPASPFNTLSWITEIKNTITNDNSAANWCLGRPSTTTTTKTVPSQSPLTRTVNHTIDYAMCRATVETVEPNDLRLKVTTTFGFDSCGNTNSVSVVGLDQNGNPMTARTTGTNYSYSTSRCALPEAVTDALLDPPTVTTYNWNFGLPATVTDPNGIQVSASSYDDFGRKTKETRADGTYTTLGYNDCVTPTCWGVANLRFLVGAYFYSSGGTQLRATNKYYDGLDRLIYDEATRVLGAWDVQVLSYDNLGRKTEATLPYSSSGNGYHLYSYDIVNRLTEDDLYTNAGACYRYIKVGYFGQTATVTSPDPNGSASCSNAGVAVTRVTDVAGKIRQVTDPNTNNTAAGTTYYTFDPFGNLSKIVDADTIPSSYMYNIRGFKTASNDADAGAWTFTPDSLNELVSQTDANANTTTFGYDLLGRMTSRTEPENPTTPTQWAYGNTKTAYNIGRIVTVTKPDGYGEGYTYDPAGRPKTVTYTEDGTNYPFTYAYNAQGTVDTLTYPVSTSGYQFVLKYVYDTAGFLNETKDSAAGTIFWQLNTANDASLSTLETLGNTVQVATSYTPWTNEMITRTEGSGGSTTNLQNLTYNWDLVGNLHNRIDNRQGLTEQFGYDSMNRLLSSALNGGPPATLTYDAAGNIVTKSDVGGSAYAYDPAHPHAVKTAGTWSMTYDANGNMIARDGGAITWYSYNLPNGISFSGNSTQFSYNASHQRWKQVAVYSGVTETTHYVGGMLEIMTRGTNATEYRHQIPAGSSIAIYTRRTDGTTSTYYATSDHLGSSDLVMDGSANVLVRESFTPFGARRGSAWTGTPTSGDNTAIGNTTRKGFTGHEMLDSVALVHMGGRVYDPFLGRFLSADTVIQSLGATESINPYAYAWNDPLRYVDPTGHGILDAIIGVVVGAIAFFTLQPELIGALGTFWGSVAAGAIAGFVGGFTGALLATGSLSAALTAGLISGVAGGLTAGIGRAVLAGNWTPLEGVLARVAVGCASSAASGGNCGQGAMSAAFAMAAAPLIIKFPALGQWSAVPESVEAGLIGGEAARLAGGKFENGFSTAAVQYLVGPQAQNAGVTNQTVGDQLVRDVAYLWSLPDTAIGLVLGGLDGLAGLVAGQVPHFGTNGMAIQISNLPSWFGLEGGITFGHVELFSGVPPDWQFTRDVPSPYTGLYGFSIENHEDAHTIQADLMGPFFLPLYGLSALFNGWSTNPFETHADYYAKYGESALPW